MIQEHHLDAIRVLVLSKGNAKSRDHEITRSSIEWWLSSDARKFISRDGLHISSASNSFHILTTIQYTIQYSSIQLIPFHLNSYAMQSNASFLYPSYNLELCTIALLTATHEQSSIAVEIMRTEHPFQFIPFCTCIPILAYIRLIVHLEMTYKVLILKAIWDWKLCLKRMLNLLQVAR